MKKRWDTNLDLFWAFLLMVLMQPLSSIPKASNAFLQLTMVTWFVGNETKDKKEKVKKGSESGDPSVTPKSTKRKKKAKQEKKKGRKEEEKNFDFCVQIEKDTHCATSSGAGMMVE